MKPCVLFFSRTGNTKRMAGVIGRSIKAPVFDIKSAKPSDVGKYDLLIVGTPVEAFNPTKECMAFIKRLPKTKDKKSILFCTYKIWRGFTFGRLSKELAKKGYKTVLSVSKKGLEPNSTAEFSDVLSKIKKFL